MTRRELADYCLTYPDAYEDYPFGDDEWVALRHLKNRRTFAFLYVRDGSLCANLKCEPMTGDFLRQVHPYVRPAYHMNKTHWITVRVNECGDIEELYSMIAESYRLTKS